MSNPNLPTVTFTVTRFRKVGGGNNNYCDYTMALANGGNQVSLNTANNTLTVSSGAPLQIVFTAAGRYLLAGITFKQVTAGLNDPVGAQAFPSVLLELSRPAGGASSTLTVTDLADNDYTYEYDLLVVGIDEQDLGLIDPPIINKPPAVQAP